jgi:hypothetical protein
MTSNLPSKIPPKTTWAVILRRPAVTLPIASGAICLALYFLVGPTLLLLSIGVLGLFVGFFAGIVVALLHPGSQARLALDARAEERSKLKRAFSRLKYEPDVESWATRALEQVDGLDPRFALFEEALASKMTPGELTYERYRSTAESVREAITQNFQTILLSIQLLHSMAESATAARAAEESRLKSLLAVNELGFTRLDEATHAVSEIKTNRDSAAVNLEATLKELQELAARASKYSTN